MIVRAATMATLIVAASPAGAAEFRHLDGPAISARFPGMDLTDEVHWRYTFRRDGTLPSTALGRDRVGSWRVEEGRLCMRQGPGMAECYAVWMSGTKVELRPDNEALPVEEGVLQRTQGRGRR